MRSTVCLLIPMPLSTTLISILLEHNGRRKDDGGIDDVKVDDGGAEAGEEETLTYMSTCADSPCLMNLTAFETRLVIHCRMRLESPLKILGTSSETWSWK